MITYTGDTEGRVFVIDGKKKKPLDPARTIGLYPNVEFEWGNKGLSHGEVRLAVAILRHALGNDADAIKFYQRYKFRVIAELPKGGPFVITKEQVEAVIADIRSVEAESASARAAVAREPAPVANERGAGIGWSKINEG